MNILKKIERDENNLIKGFDYKFTTEGLVDWRSLVKKEYLYPNPQNKEKLAQKYNKKYEELDVVNDKIEDIDLVIKLAGLRELARVKGFKSIEYRPIVASESYCATVCRIVWIGDFESENREIVFEAMASASPTTTKGFGQNYLIEMSENRALCRCVRESLSINIVSNFELGTDKLVEESSYSSNSNNLLDPVNTLSKIIENKGKTPEKFLKRCVEVWNIEEAKNWKNLNDIPKDKILGLIEKLNS